MDFSIEIERAIQVTLCTAVIIFIISIAVGFPVESLMVSSSTSPHAEISMMMMVMKTAISNINKSFLLQLPSDES